MDTASFTSASSAALPNGTDNNNIKGLGKTVATAFTGGAIGSGFPFIIGKVKESVNELHPEEATTEESVSSVERADNEIQVATDVNDSILFNEILFNEAFTAD